MEGCYYTWQDGWGMHKCLMIKGHRPAGTPHPNDTLYVKHRCECDAITFEKVG